MTLEEAIKTALEYENKVWNYYQTALNASKDEMGKKIFNILAQEEKHHVDYLNSRLSEWRATGKLHIEPLKTTIPQKQFIMSGMKKLQDRTKEAKKLDGHEQALLQKALEAETDTYSFYRKMVSELSDEGQKLFSRFLEIEEGHVAIVQAELDAVTGLGFWFDMQEFGLENA